MCNKIRLDLYLNKKYKFSRNHSKEVISKGLISINNQVIFKPSFKIKEEDDILQIDENAFPKYISRGGIKLEKALNFFNINLTNLVCLDVGASTGGFTDCMIKNGAKKVYAVDVGTSQLHSSLLNNQKVISMENTDIRNISKKFFSENISFISVDVSFISVTKILENIFNIISENGQIILLIKPQFEVGRNNIGKNGVVKDIKVHKIILKEILNFTKNIGFLLYNLTFSPIKGGNGNIEYFLYIKKSKGPNEFDFNKLNLVVDSAFKEL